MRKKIFSENHFAFLQREFEESFSRGDFYAAKSILERMPSAYGLEEKEKRLIVMAEGYRALAEIAEGFLTPKIEGRLKERAKEIREAGKERFGCETYQPDGLPHLAVLLEKELVELDRYRNICDVETLERLNRAHSL